MNTPTDGAAYRDIIDFPGYRVGDDGSVWTCWRGKNPPRMSGHWKLLKPRPGRRGHLRVGLYRDRRQHWIFVHRLVLEAFVGPCPAGMEACHFPDRDPTNNRVRNLRWDTKAANAADKRAHGTLPEGERHVCHKLTSAQVAAIRQRAAGGERQRPLAAEFGVTQAAISLIVRGEKWKTDYQKPGRPGVELRIEGK